MRIIIDLRSAYHAVGTGIGSYALSFFHALRDIKTQDEIRFITPANVELPELPGNMSYLSCPYEKKEARIFITEALAELKPDVFFLPQNGLHYPLYKNCRWVVTIHDLIPFMMPDAVHRGYFRHFLKEMPGLVRLSDRIITVSRATANDLMNFFYLPKEKIRVIPAGPADSFYPRPSALSFQDLKKKYPGLRTPFFLYVGGLNPRKNIPFLLLAFSRICRLLPGFHQLVIAGQDPARLSKLKMLADALSIKEYVYFPGYLPEEDLPLFYSAASLFFYPSQYEGFGLPPLEAMACGTPALVSNIHSLKEVVGRAGLKFPPGNLDRFCRIVCDTVKNPALIQELREKGIKRAALFRWKRLAKNILNALTDWR